MVVIVLPNFVIELEEKLDKVIKDLAIKNKIDLTAVNDSKEIFEGKDFISNALVRIFENYGVEDRKRMEEFEESMKGKGCGKIYEHPSLGAYECREGELCPECMKKQTPKIKDKKVKR